MKKFEDFEAMVMLDLPDAERVRILERYDDIIAGFSKLDGVDVSGVEPLVSVLEHKNVMREDVACKVFSRDELLENAPERLDANGRSNGYFSVPAAIE